MGRSADGGCGTEERPCHPISSVSGRSPAWKPENALKRLSFDDVGVDFFSQAGKVLSERSPFDIPEGGSISELSVPTLPSGLASLLKQADSRKKHKKSHSGADKKSSKQKEKKQGGSIWVETKEYFRDLALQDIDALFKITPSSSLAARKKCFIIPYVGDEPRSSSGLGWLLGSRSRRLTSERPFKKRKLLGDNDGLKKKNDSNDAGKPCTLCPKQGGALKPIQKSDENNGSMEFAHMFCSIWMPEVYVEDLTKMEPIINVGEVKETRKKLVCNVCRVKYGACVPCSHGTCRNSFHPLCAREAGHRMEVWARYGCDNIEMRAFCSKHSEIRNNSSSPQLGELCAAANDFSIANQFSPTSTEKSQNLKIGHKDEDKITVDIHDPDDNSDKSGDGELQEIGFFDTRLDARVLSEYGDLQQLVDMGLQERSNINDHDPSDPHNFALVLKKLIAQGKVNVKDLALEVGLSDDSLSASLDGDSLAPDLQGKLMKWLKNHAYMGSSPKKLKVKIKPLMSSKDETGATDGYDNIMDFMSDITNPVAVKSVPPRRRTKSNARILRDNEVICSSDEIINDNGLVMDKVMVDSLAKEELYDLSEASILDAIGKNSAKPDDSLDSSDRHLPASEGNSPDLSNDGFSERSRSEMAATPEKITVATSEQESSIFPIVNLIVGKFEDGMNTLNELDGKRERDCSCLVAASTDSVHSSHESEHPKCNEKSCTPDDLDFFIKARKLRSLKLSPKDEVEGEIIYYQDRLMHNIIARNCVTDNLVSRVAKSLPVEVEAAREQRWDAVLANQYLYDIREAKKQGRKERRHKEAQANILKLNACAGRAGISLQQRSKDAWDAVPRISSGKYSDIVQSVSDFSKEHPRSCDICRRSETLLNPIFVCSGCKVAVHLDCYRSVKEPLGPWCCELCEELFSSRSSEATSLNFWEISYPAAHCGLCGGTTGAFRKSVDGQWVHAFCAEWVLESTFRRGQVNPVEGMEKASRGVDICCICHRKHGACIKCSYNHCQTTFHPSCARSAGFCMNVMLAGGKFQRNAFCEKHSVEQRAKAETQKHGVEELKNMKQIRVKLERLRLLCDRIIKREKLKRELVVCSHEILARKRDHVTRSLLFHSPFHPDVSSESATTSLKGHTDGYRSCSESMRSDDITVDSTLSVKHQIKIPVSVENDQRTDDSSTSQSPFVPKPMDRVRFSGKQIPQRYSLASRNSLDNAERNLKLRKPIETFEKELVMTSDEASMKNSRLPKGYCYVPVDCLPKEKQHAQDACSDGQLEHNG
ncbi:hypothetical protein GOBAR_AA32315 [Gossypium barbadense]|uniref:PHD-type domain-containing protein n=1 Tax=Gossypium barbadense TaxID=3634 RepID=A0A2P5WBB4_GOSBA|nr:hypothetical protein GOBAR_AA32315 [Gossypium barbadense]